ncbi:MAG: PH domain-containing protein [Planctomycetes bacterium]|nr:PH domain-containing protein [Planctomycetota bacterium]
MSEPVINVASWMYEGIWSGLTEYFRVPRKAPSIPARRAGGGETHESFRPAAGFLGYLKFFFWLICVLILVGLIILSITIMITEFSLGVILLLVFLVVILLPASVAYLAIHLRYDTTWYVMTDRSLRIRRGIWVIHETTITFENIQNVSVSQGPLQRYFGISDVVVETAGGGGDSKQKGLQVSNQGIIEGIANADEIRDRILSRMRQSVSAGLGDEAEGGQSIGRARWTPEHLTALRDIRAEIALLSN